jgi:hypothetical protein
MLKAEQMRRTEISEIHFLNAVTECRVMDHKYNENI